MSKITIVIPVHEFNDEVKFNLEFALSSIERQEEYDERNLVMIVCPKNVYDELSYLTSKFSNFDIKLLENKGDTDFQSQVNFAVSNVTTEYFSVLEFDDELSSKYFKNVNKYIEHMPDVDIFLAMMVEVTSEGDKNIINKYTNENVWSHQFVGENGEVGYLSSQSLKEYSDFKLSGAVIKKSEFVNIGGYKKNIKLTFGYELLLRALNNSCKVYTIPKFIHINHVLSIHI
jgi:hypothetical protein